MINNHAISPLTAEFTDAETESIFRRETESQRLRMIAITFRFAALAYMGALWIDYQTYSALADINSIYALRISIIGLFLGSSFAVYRFKSNTDTIVLAIILYFAFALALIEGIHNGAPSQEISAVTVTFCIYLAVPNRLILSAMAGIFFGLCVFYSIAVLQPSVDLSAEFLLIIAASNVFGVLVWRQFNLLRRREFRSVQKISESRSDLIAEVNLRKSMDSELRKALQAAKTASAAKSKMLATVGHELRTPLNAIIGFAGLADQTLGDINSKSDSALRNDNSKQHISDLETSFSHIDTSGRHMLSVIDALLDDAKMSSRADELMEEIVVANDLPGAPFSIFQSLAQKAGIELVLSLHPQPPLVRVDVVRVRQIIINLLSNAVKFTPAGGRVDLSVRSDSDGTIIITVADNGVGIEEGAIEGIFEPFTRYSEKGIRGESSTGLGLALSRNMAELHGGSITASSVLGEGASFSLNIPPDRVFSGPGDIADLHRIRA
jgi:signal transduction histidine kinase